MKSIFYSPAPQLSLFIFALTLQIAGSVVSPLTAAANPVARQYALADALGISIKGLQESSFEREIYVHWLYLNQDELIDAIVILKSDSSSCGVSANCTGKIFEATKEGFRVVSVFLPNHHPLYFSSLSNGKKLRDFYVTENGSNFTEFAFDGGRYRLSRKNLSQALVESIAPLIVDEVNFDNLVVQIADIQKSGSHPVGAPIILQVVTPAASMSAPLIKSSFQLTQKLEPKIRGFLNRLAKTYFLTHTVTVELVPCDDWVARIPLKNQEDRSPKHVVVCQEIFGMLDDQFVPIIEKEITHYLQRIKKNTERAIKTGESTWTLRKLDNEIRARKKMFEETNVLNPRTFNHQEQINAAIFILLGSLGQPLSLQANVLQKVLMEIDTNKTTDGNTLVSWRKKLTRDRVNLFYLFGHLLLSGEVYSGTLGIADFLSRISVFKEYEKAKWYLFYGITDRKEYAVLQNDLDVRLWAGSCAERTQMKNEGESLLFYYEKLHKNANWEFCDHLSKSLNFLTKKGRSIR